MAKKTYAKKYKVGDEVVPGVTTIIKTSLGWGMHALIAWNVKMVREGKDPKEVMQGAADSGTLAHSLVELWCRQELGQEAPELAEVEDGYTPEQVKAAHNALAAFHMWREGSKLTLVASEEEIVNPQYKFGGTIDLIFKDNLESIHIVDMKTTNYLLPDHLIQIAAYCKAYEWKYDKLVRYGHMLRFGKGDTTVFHHTAWDNAGMDIGFNAFLHLRALYDAKKLIEGLC